MTDAELKLRWYSDGEDVLCDLHEHFEDVDSGFTFWTDSADEACRVFAILSDDEIPEECSLIRECIAGAAASGFDVAVHQIARALGVDQHIIATLANSDAINGEAGVVEDVRSVLFAKLQTLGVQEPTEEQMCDIAARHGFARHAN